MQRMITSLKKFIALLLIVLVQFILSPQKAYAATAPDLGAAGSYSVLGGETVTNTGPTTMLGDLGVSPGSAVTAFPPGIVTLPYTIHIADANAAAAQISNFAAFDFLDQDCTTTYTGTQDLVGLTLVPGVYCADAFTLSGTLTLNGLSTDVWIFKSTSSLITSGTAEVVGNNPCNVWWRVVSSATLGTGTKFIGSILAHISIWMRTGASLNGRALAQVGEVTLDSNTITGAICLTAPIAVPTLAPTPPICVGEEHLNASGTICVNFSPSGPPESGGTTTTTTTTSTGQVLGVSTLASTGAGNSKLGVMLMLLGAGITLTSLYALKKRAI
jgi:type VI secretion system secreted protein VgrG